MKSNDAKLQKVTLGPDWIDLSFGEPKVVMQAMYAQINRFGSTFAMPETKDLNRWEYQPAAGNIEFVKLLEEKYDARVVVTNGAKQALGACMSALRRAEARYGTIYYDTPFYPANPSIAEASGLIWAPKASASTILVTSPNNPDGKNYTNIQMVAEQTLRPMIHDAAYYTPIYLPEWQLPIPLGRMQIYSMSKMYGLSGLRIGYAVCHDEQFYQHVVDYIEETTAGVSTASQDIAMQIEQFFLKNPDCRLEFETEARESIKASRQELLALDPEVLIPVTSEANSMFAWCIARPGLDNVSAKVHLLEGTLFGKPGMVRINTAHPAEVIREAVKRLNDHKIRS